MMTVPRGKAQEAITKSFVTLFGKTYPPKRGNSLFPRSRINTTPTRTPTEVTTVEEAMMIKTKEKVNTFRSSSGRPYQTNKRILSTRKTRIQETKEVIHVD